MLYLSAQAFETAGCIAVRTAWTKGLQSVFLNKKPSAISLQTDGSDAWIDSTGYQFCSAIRPAISAVIF